jgi:hypothetical protein
VKVLFLLGHVVPHVLVLEAAVALLCQLVAQSHGTTNDTTHDTRTRTTAHAHGTRVKMCSVGSEMRSGEYLDLVLGHVGEVDVAADVLPHRDVGQHGVWIIMDEEERKR